MVISDGPFQDYNKNGMRGVTVKRPRNMNRSWIELVFDILDLLSEGPERPTRMLYRANLSWYLMSRYIAFLITTGLIVEGEDNKGHREFYITARGRRALRTYRYLEENIMGPPAPRTWSERAGGGCQTRDDAERTRLKFIEHKYQARFYVNYRRPAGFRM